MRRPAMIHVVAASVCLAAGAAVSMAQTPVDNSWTFQGRLTDGGAPANGTYDLRFSLLGDAAGTIPVGAYVLRPGVAVTAGLFSVDLEFPNVNSTFIGSKRWLKVEVSPPGAGTYTALPLQEIHSAPQSLFSLRPWEQTANGIAYNVGGHVGINTTTPAQWLTVMTATNDYGFSHTDGAITLASYVGGGGAGGYFGTRSNHPLHFFANDSDPLMTVTPNRRVGIGTLTPAYKLTVITTGGDIGVYGQTDTGRGVAGWATSTGWGVTGDSPATGHFGILATPNEGAYGSSTTKTGVHGVSTGGGTFSFGVNGESTALQGAGVRGECNNGTLAYGVWGLSTTGFAGFFNGKVQVTGNLSKAGGSFKIDHPLDPANQYLYHSFVESPDMKNIYDGNVQLDASGVAVVMMPDWFDALNTEFRYQLTALGAPGPNLYIAQEMDRGRFVIAGGVPRASVSWQVTGIRRDAWANANRIPVEEAKPAAERGRYLHPELFGMPASASVDKAPPTAPR